MSEPSSWSGVGYGGVPAAAGRAVVDWFAPVVPDSRIAILRSVLYAFVLLDINAFVRDPPELARQPGLYQPLAFETWLRLPTPTPTLTTILSAVLWLTCLLGIANVSPRLVGLVCAAAFTYWVGIGFSYGKIDHDHLALVVALWVLPSVGAVRGRWRSPDRSQAAGWALRCIQIAVVCTYFLSAVTKIRSGGWSLSSWPDSAILTWAIVHRPHGLGQFVVNDPRLLHVMQWMSILAELSSPVVLFLRGRALLFGALFWLGFHLFTLALLYIHFAPTVVCWLAFAPLERIGPWWQRHRRR